MTKKVTAFIGGAHFDRMGKLTGQALQGASNPGLLKSMPGGAGLNTARVAAKLGAGAGLCSPVGDDLEAERLHQLLEREGIADGLVEMVGRDTGSYVSIIAADGELIIGLNDLALNEEMSAQWVLDNCGDLLSEANQWFVTANLARSTVRELVEGADVPIIAATISQAKAIRFRGVLDKVELMFTNVKEAQSLLGRQEGEAVELAEVLMARGVKSGVITNGGGDMSYWVDGSVVALPVPGVDNIVDVTGAGDAMAGCVIACLGRGMALGDAVKMGVIAAGKTIQTGNPVVENLSWEMLEEAEK